MNGKSNRAKMRILIVGLVEKNEHFLRVKKEGEKRGHTVHGCYASDLMVYFEEDEFRVFLKNRDPIESYDVVYLWALGKRRWEWQVAAVHVTQNSPVYFVNASFTNFDDLSFTDSFLHQLRVQIANKLPFPRSVMIYNKNSLGFVKDQFKFPLIVKFANSKKGLGVFLVKSEEELFRQVGEMQETKKAILLRDYIPNDGDIRVFTVGYKAVGAMKRVSKEGDFRSNISQGGSGLSYNLSENPNIREIAEKVSKELKIEIAGVDIMIHKETGKPYILEVNQGPQFLGLEKYTEVNAACEIIKYFECLFEKKSSR